MPKRHTAAEFRESVKHLYSVAGFARDYHVDVVHAKDGELPADTAGNSDLVEPTGRFIIRIHRGCTVDEMVETLVHEAAHILDWHPYTPYSQNHGPTWGVRYAEVYCRFWSVA